VKKSLFYLVLVVAGVLGVGLPADSSAEFYGIGQQTPIYAASQMTMYAAKDEGQWEIYDQNGNVVGTVKRTEQGNFKFYDKGGKFGGLILRSGIWLPAPSERRIRISPGSARLYLDALGTIETMK
jgi:hypothetical protein